MGTFDHASSDAYAASVKRKAEEANSPVLVSASLAFYEDIAVFGG
jgi:hypothetical protein